ncbi:MULTISPECIES: hypothetical protein [Methylomonas]|uniref:Calcineurin-like phosphoesterase domain-containing protein n=1 Tax=Methylomonas koyamae TaxID=702114 RepID=A0A177P0F7_9GAMM|nr:MULTISPECIES: hypothetical protein [Methylomonas]NJA06129.1 hypothetical protein [Methylococcaceae bacterium WWC4]OAI22983.1 hypothetical protein A1355_22110 [Methylomonas koyamae]WGS88092.1 hypothetical protein QC632_10100 [Methylomonas sp. UP202]
MRTLFMHVKLLLPASALCVAGLLFAASANADGDRRDDENADRPVTIAVIGDWPYNKLLLDNAHLLIDSVNADPAVSRLIHVGDIHAGSMPCTSADILPPIPLSNPGYNQKIFYQFQQFDKPVVYTPGDNEWTDCQKSKQFKSGDPLKELASVRGLFFAKPGVTLGKEAQVVSQARAFDPSFPSDAQFVENAMWQQGKVVFATLNVPGSNNDTLPWAGTFANQAAQDQEVAERTAADLRWLEATFKKAKKDHARAVVIAIQADMWDPAAITATTNELSAYTPIVQKLADLTDDFRGQVLLLNGDSHVYGSDRPLADPSSATGVIHHTQAVPNLTRITVQGSTTAPSEWLRLTIDPRKPQPFQWENVAYCNDPSLSCE